MNLIKPVLFFIMSIAGIALLFYGRSSERKFQKQYGRTVAQCYRDSWYLHLFPSVLAIGLEVLLCQSIWLM